MIKMIAYSWADVVRTVLANPVHVDTSFAKSTLPPPTSSGFVASIGELKGQLADWRLPLPDKRGIHAVEFENKYSAHWDNKDPTMDWLGHLLEDAFHWVIIIGAIAAFAIVGIVWYLWSRSKDDE